jgi:acetoin utilization deacetylase AcuC-like enzyme
LHRYPHYPGTGRFSEANCFNFPLSSNTGDEKYLETLKKALSQVDIDKYEVIALSAGFDCHKGDLASLDLTSNCFKEIGKIIKSLGKPVFGVLEGGYIGENIGGDLHNLIQGLEGKDE